MMMIPNRNEKYDPLKGEVDRWSTLSGTIEIPSGSLVLVLPGGAILTLHSSNGSGQPVDAADRRAAETIREWLVNRQKEKCPKCEGKGVLWDWNVQAANETGYIVKCHECLGAGLVDDTSGPTGMSDKPCPSCNGTGRLPQ